MNLLAIETATEACSAALFCDGRIIECYQVAPREHNRLILPMIESVLAEAGLAVRQLDALAFGRGPGSFTGVRIAAGVIQGIAFGADLPVVPVSTLAALAQEALSETGSEYAYACIDARMGEVYWGVYRVGNSLPLGEGGVRESKEDFMPSNLSLSVRSVGVEGMESELNSPHLNPLPEGEGDNSRLSGGNSIPAWVELVGEEAVLPADRVPFPEDSRGVGTGSGWTSYGPQLAERLGGRVEGVLVNRFPRAALVARLGAEAFRRGISVPAEQAQPVYLRDNVAKKPAPCP